MDTRERSRAISELSQEKLAHWVSQVETEEGQKSMMYLLLICQITLAVVLSLAATGKILNSEEFLAALRLSRVPRALILPTAVLTPLLEMCLAVGILLSPTRFLPLIMAMTVGLLGIFTLWMLNVYARGLRLKCGCFGTASSDIGPRSILRNVLLVALALGGLMLTLLTQSPLPAPSLWMLITILSLGMCLVHIQAFQKGRAALILSTAQLLQFETKAESLDKSKGGD